MRPSASTPQTVLDRRIVADLGAGRRRRRAARCHLILGIMAVTAAKLILAGLEEIGGQENDRPLARLREARSESGGESALELARTGRWHELQQGIAAGLPPDPPGTGRMRVPRSCTRRWPAASALRRRFWRPAHD